MRNVKDNLWIPDEGYKYLTDGVTYTDSIYLGKGQNINVWHDTNDEPHDPDLEEEIADEEALEILLGGAT